MAAHIHRLRRTDNTGQHLLVRVETQGRPLDLKLIGTEFSSLYYASFRESGVKSLQASNYSGDLQQWKDTLKYALLYERTAGPLPEFLQGVEVVAAISGETLTITLRKNIGGITQRLGSIKLEEDMSDEVSGFEWADTAVASADNLRNQLETLQASMSEQQDAVSKLNQQLDELVKAKKEHEDEMLKKFATLLNAKKLKIRDQQRLLATAKIDSKAANEVRNARSGRGHQAGASRSGKRKGIEAEEPEESDEVEEEKEVNEDEDEEMQQETPPVTDDDATEDEDDLDAPTQSNKGKAPASKMDVDDPPPTRELPVQKRPNQPAPATDDDDETDDEL